MIVERFAPSPTGLLHLGHAYSALLAYKSAKNSNGRFLLRIEDIDFNRSKLEFETQIFEDLAWLGLSWEKPVLRQSERTEAYETALETLSEKGLIYPCTCTRKDISIASAPQEGGESLLGPDGIIYPGTCKNRGKIVKNAALRLKTEGIFQKTYSFEEIGEGPNGQTGTIKFTLDDVIKQIGDVILARKDIGTSYHLSVVLDDAFQGVTHVTRGNDLFEATKIHIVLQRALGLPTPIYRHHRLIRDGDQKRLAKRDDAKSLKKYKEQGVTSESLLNSLRFSL